MSIALRAIVLVSAAASFLAAGARGQTALYVQDGKVWNLVRDMHGSTPLISSGGRLVPSDAKNVALRSVEEYSPVFVAVRDFSVNRSAMERPGTGETFNNFLDVQAKLESGTPLERVYFALDFPADEAPRRVFVHAVGRLAPHKTAVVALGLPIVGELKNKKLIFHLYSDGIEVLQSQIPFDVREAYLDRLVAKRIQGLDNAMPRPLVGPVPAYPAALALSKAAGRAVLLLHLSPRGTVLDSSVESATDPAFGASAAEAVASWRFIPRVKDAKPTKVTIELPFEFTYSEPEKAGG